MADRINFKAKNNSHQTNLKKGAVEESFRKSSNEGIYFNDEQESPINASKYDIPRRNRLRIELGRRPSLCDCSAR